MGIIIDGLAIALGCLFGGLLSKKIAFKNNSALAIGVMIISIVGFLENLLSISEGGKIVGEHTVTVVIALVLGCFIGDLLKIEERISLLSSGKRRARMPSLSEYIAKKLSEISALEKEGCPSVDTPAHLFGELLGEVFANGLAGKDEVVCREFGYHLGRFIYAADAAEDYEADRKSGKYNPYVLLYSGRELTRENKQSIKCALILECEGMERAVDLMPFGSRATIENIVRNIIYLGLIKRIDFLDRDSKTKEKSK